jgi:hypothetical protein
MRKFTLLVCLATLSGCKPSPGLKFLANQTTVYQTGFTNGYSQIFPEGDLKNLPNTCVDGLQESFQGRNYGRTMGSEVVLFAREPSSVENQLEHLSDAANLTGGWVKQSAVPQAIPNPLALPVVLGVEGQTPDPPPVVSYPTAAAFWGTGQPFLPSLQYRSCAPLGTLNRATGAEVNAFAVYHHGACDATQSLTDIIGDVVDGLWNGFEYSGQVDGPQSHYRHAISVLELGSLADGKNGSTVPMSDVRGGFLLAFHFRGNYAKNNNEVWGTYKYLFSLVNGFVQVAKSDVQRLSLDSSGAWGWAFKDHLQTALEKTIPDHIQAKSIEAQEVALPAPASCSFIDDCPVASGFLANSLTAAKLQAAGVSSPTASQVSRIRCAVGSQIDCTNLGRAAPDFNKLWDCPLLNGAFNTPLKPCKFRLPAKRLLMLPDSLELVWFDDFEFDNPVFGIFVAAAGDQSQTQKLCSTALPSVGPNGFFVRQFAQAGHFGN